MPEECEAIITVRKEVPDRDKAKDFYEEVKLKLAELENIKIRGHVTNHFDPE